MCNQVSFLKNDNFLTIKWQGWFQDFRSEGIKCINDRPNVASWWHCLFFKKWYLSSRDAILDVLCFSEYVVLKSVK